MFTNMKKIALFALPFALASSALTAGEMSDRTKRLEGQMKDVRGNNPTGKPGAVTAPLGVNLQNSNGWFFTVNAMYWQANIANNDFAQTDASIDRVSGSLLPSVGKEIQADYNWDWGFRFGVGKLFKHDNWDLAARYTFFDATTSSKIGFSDNSVVLPTRGQSSIVGSPNSFGFATDARAQGSINFQSVDLTLGRAYYVSRDLSFHPNWGLQATFLDSKESIEYSGGDQFGTTLGLNGLTTDPNYPLNANVKVIDNSKFWAIGPRVGVDAQFHVSEGVSIYTNLATSLLYADQELRHKDIYSANVDVNKINVLSRFHQFVPTIDALIGLRYDGYFNNDAQHLGIGLGWEIQYLFNAIQRGVHGNSGRPYGSATISKDFSTQGLTIDLRFDF